MSLPARSPQVRAHGRYLCGLARLSAWVCYTPRTAHNEPSGSSLPNSTHHVSSNVLLRCHVIEGVPPGSKGARLACLPVFQSSPGLSGAATRLSVADVVEKMANAEALRNRGDCRYF